MKTPNPMAVFRKIHVSFWSDPDVEAMTPEQKYFYLYLLTNEKTTQCGIYEISKRKMSNDTGYNVETVEKLLAWFQNCGKLRYSEKTGEIALRNWPKYNGSTSPKVKACITKELVHVKDRVLILYLYSMDTHPQEEKEKEKEEEQEREEETQTRTKPQDEFYGLDECLAIALRDPRWVKLNQADEAQLRKFNEYLEAQGRYEMVPFDYKSYFHHTKKKKPELLTRKLSIDDLRRMAAELDEQERKMKAV